VLHILIDLVTCEDHAEDHRENEPSLVVEQEGKFEGVLLSKVALDEVERAHLVLELSKDECPHEGPLALVEHLLNVRYLPLMKRKVFHDNARRDEVVEINLIFQDAQNGFDPLSRVEHRELWLVLRLERHFALNE